MVGQQVGQGRTWLEFPSTPIRCLADSNRTFLPVIGVSTTQTIRCLQESSPQPDYLYLRRTDRIWLRHLYKPLCSRLATLNASSLGKVKMSSCSSSCMTAENFQIMCNESQSDTVMDVLLLLDEQGIIPSVNRYRSLLKACGKRKALAQAKHIYAHLCKHGLESARILAEDVVSTLVKCNGLPDALQVFYSLPQRSVFAWTAIISGYTVSGQGRKALRMYDSMREEGLQPDKYVFISLLQACGGLSDLEEGKRIHFDSIKYACSSDLIVSTCLIDMYGKCGSPLDAHNVFDGLSHPDVVSWNAMLSAYVQKGQADKAFELYERMQEEGVSGNNRTFVSMLQVCGILAEKEQAVVVNGLSTKAISLARVKAIHADARRKGHDVDVFVGGTLLNMYMKCRSPVDMQIVFNRSFVQDVVSWTTMFAAYVEQGEAEIALQLYERMLVKGVSPNCRTFVSVFHICGLLAEKEEDVVMGGQMTKITSLSKGKVLHAYAQRKGCSSDGFVGNSLVSMYGKCGSLVDAQYVFDAVSQQDVVTWNALLASYAQQGQPEMALQLYREMLQNNVRPTGRTFVSALQACGVLAEKEDAIVGEQASKVVALQMGKAIHAEALIEGYAMDVFVGNTLLSMYGKCGSILDAEIVLDELSHPDGMSWTAMMTTYAQHGQVEMALQLFEQMLEEEVSPIDVTFVTTLQACGLLAESDDDLVKAKYLEKGKALHADAWRRGHRSHVLIGNSLVSMYGKCGSFVDAKNVFECMSERDVVSWNVMLAVYAQHGQVEEALQLYDEMQKEGVSPDDRTFVSVVQACSMLAEVEAIDVVHGQFTKVDSLGKGKGIHANAWGKGYNLDVFVGSTLVTMYMNCGSILDAQDVFDKLTDRDVVSWTAMLTAYGQQGQLDKALHLYERMHEEGVSPNNWAFVSVCQVCGMFADEEAAIPDGTSTKVKSLQMARAIHADAWRKGYVTDVFIGNTLVSVYSKCGSIMDAQMVFDGLSHQDVVSWTAILNAYAQQNQGERALQLYSEMKGAGVNPNEVTFVCILQVCSNTGALGICRQIHQQFVSTGTQLSHLLASCLLHAYGRCGSMVDAQSVFDALHHPDLVTWTTLIACYARQGDCAATLQCYENMQLAGIKPDGVTFLSLLSACSHAGLVDQGVAYFESMIRDYGIPLEIQHYVSMVDLLGRAGCFTRVEDLFSTMPMQPNLAFWLCLLGACQKHGELELGERAFKYAVYLEPTHSAAYVIMSNIYADAGLWEPADEVAWLRQVAKAWKQPGQSWIEHEQQVHTFLVGDRKFQPQDKITVLVRKLCRKLKGGSLQ